MPANSMSICHAYALDLLNLFNVLTGDEFYTTRHPGAYDYWSARISRAGTAAVREAVADWGSAMIGPPLSYAFSAIPGFAELEPSRLFAQVNAVGENLRALPGHSDWYIQRLENLCRKLAPVADELEELGFHAYWTSERLPEINKAAAEMEQFLAGLRLDINKAVSDFRGDRDRRRDQPIELYLCTFASPHGIKLIGDRFISDVAYQPQITVRIAIHEMFHPPYQLQEVEQETKALMADDLFQESFRTKDPRYGYPAEPDFLEENIVEAMEVYVSKCAGLLDDPVGYLVRHDDGSHRLSVVLVKYFGTIPKSPAESFADYLKRLVREMPVGRLTEEYQQEIATWHTGKK